MNQSTEKLLKLLENYSVKLIEKEIEIETEKGNIVLSEDLYLDLLKSNSLTPDDIFEYLKKLL